MTTNSGQAQHAPNPPQESVDEVRSSGQQAPRTLAAGVEQVPAPTDARDDNMAGGARSVAASPPGQQQAPPAGYQEGTADAESGYQQDTSGRIDSVSATRQQTGAAAQTPQREVAPGSEDGSFGVDDSAVIEGTRHSLIADPSGYSRRWESIQVGFVDDPRSAVQEAETLVSDVMREMVGLFQRQRQQLEEQWSGGNQASTDDLRVAFRRYRDFFQRLLQM